MKRSSATKRTRQRTTQVLSICLYPEQMSRLEQLASSEIRSKSTMARLLINEAIEAREQPAVS